MKKLTICFGFIFIIFASVIFSACGCEHNFGKWTTQTPATCTQKEVLVRKCKNCNFQETKEGTIKHSYNESIIAPNENENGYTLCECECGDFYYKDHTCLISFENSNIDENLPIVNAKVVSKGSMFCGVNNTINFRVKQYKKVLSNGETVDISIGDKIEQATKIQIVWEDANYTENETNFNEIIKKIQKLEQISYNYNQKDHILRTLQFIRNSRYKSSQWNTFGGTLESDFESYVTQNQGVDNLFELQTLGLINIPNTNQKLDFVHEIAIINVAYNLTLNNKSALEMVGYAGDLCQLVKEVSTYNLTGEELETTVKEKFNSNSSTFSSSDLIADIDAVNLSYIMNNNNSLGEVISSYYYGTNNEQRINLFLLNNFHSLSYEEMVNEIILRIEKNTYIKMWCNQNGISLEKNREEFEVCAKAFAKYFY